MPQIPTMPQAPDWNQVLEAGMQFTEMRRSRARDLVSELVAQGHVAREQMSGLVDDLVESSRRRRNELRRIVQKEVQRQLGLLGLATKADLAALERRMMRASRESARAAKSDSAKKKAAGKKTEESAAKRTAKAAQEAS
jgi:polyhydroxyalkanoate synthesis regulator phasin